MEEHILTVENRNKLTINRVIDVDAFDENNLWANIQDGAIEIIGENLNIEKLDLDEGLLMVTGKIYSFGYVDKKIKEKRLFAKVFRRNI